MDREVVRNSQNRKLELTSSVFLIFYFALPYLLFLKFFSPTVAFQWSDFFWAFKNSFLQSFLTASFVVVLAFWMSLGLFTISDKYRDLVKKALLIPQVLPSFYAILIAFQLIQPFPIGLMGIIIVLTLIHLGYATVVLHTSAIEKVGTLGLVAEVFGVRRLNFLFSVYFKALIPDLILVFILIFTFSFSSFAVPLIAGGGRSANLEVLIFEKIFIDQNWSMAWILSVIQSVFLAILSFCLIRNSYEQKTEYWPSRRMSSYLGLGLISAYLLMYLGGYAYGSLKAILDYQQMLPFTSELFRATQNSLIQALLVVTIHFLLLIVWLVYFVEKMNSHKIGNVFSLSTVVVGFALYLSFPQSAFWDLVKVPLAISFVFFLSLTKSFVEKPLLLLQQQVVVAKIYGLSRWKIIMNILLPQLKPALRIWTIFLLIGFLSEFALLRALGTQTLNLGLLAEGFLSSYRLHLSFLTSFWILIVWGALCFVLNLLTERMFGSD